MGLINSRVFLSGSSYQRDYLAAVAVDLSRLGFVVLDSWRHEITDGKIVATIRWHDLLNADILAVFDSTQTCLLEVGAALALAHPIVMIGAEEEPESATLWLPTIDHYKTWNEAMEFFERPETLHLKRRNKRVSL